MLNGGVHAANRLDFEEFMIIPAGAATFSDALRIGVEVFHELRYTLLARGRSVLMGADGGFAPDLESNESALEMLVTAIRAAGYEPGWDVWIGIDAAATQLRDDGGYALAHEGRHLSSDDLAGYYDELTDRYPVLLLEDGMGEDDWQGWEELTAHLGRRLELAGDDLFVTNAERLREGIAAGVANAIVIKPNQIGTLTETLETIRVAQASDYATLIAQRSGETEDTSICDLAVATGSTQIKAGAPSRERVAQVQPAAPDRGDARIRCHVRRAERVLPRSVRGLGMTLSVPIPGRAELGLDHLLLDVNGTLTNRGVLIDGVEDRLERLREHTRDPAGFCGHVRDARCDRRAPRGRRPTRVERRGQATGAQRAGPRTVRGHRQRRE